MLKKLAQSMNNTDINQQTDRLKLLARHVAAAAKELGLSDADGNCRTVCEEQLVVINGRLQRKVVCRVVCSS